MSRLEVPLVSRTLSTTGDDVVRAELVLEVKTSQGTRANFRFLVDTGTEMTTMQAEEAKSRGLPIPGRPVRGLALHGQEVRSGGNPIATGLVSFQRLPGCSSKKMVIVILGVENGESVSYAETGQTPAGPEGEEACSR